MIKSFDNYINESVNTYTAFVIYTKQGDKLLYGYQDINGDSTIFSMIDDKHKYDSIGMYKDKRSFDLAIDTIKDADNFRSMEKY